MATTMTLAELRIAVRQRADQVNSQFVTDLELTSYINQSAFELYDLLVQKFGNDYFVGSPYEFVTEGGTAMYPLPADFFKLLGVDLLIGANDQGWVTLKPFEFADRNRYTLPNFQTFVGYTNTRYRLQGDNLWFTPEPQGGQTIRLWYVPRMPTMAADADALEGVSGWTEYVIVDAAIKCMAKEESDPSVLMAQKQGLIQRIEAAAENRNIAQPQRVSDVLGSEMLWSPGGGYPGGWGNA